MRTPHRTELYEWALPEGTRHSAECLTCDWTTTKSDTADDVIRLAAYHRRHPDD